MQNAHKIFVFIEYNCNTVIQNCQIGFDFLPLFYNESTHTSHQ